jgi:hypothetical protein
MKGSKNMENVFAVRITRSLEESIKSKSKKIKKLDENYARESVKDCTVKYWEQKFLKNKLKDIEIVIGIYKNRIHSAFKVDDNKEIERDILRIEFVCTESVDWLIGIYLVDAEDGGWGNKFYTIDYLKELAKEQENSIAAEKEKIMAFYYSKNIIYNPEHTCDYAIHHQEAKNKKPRNKDSVRHETNKRANYKCELCANMAEIGGDIADFWDYFKSELSGHGNKVVCHHIKRRLIGGDDEIYNTMCLCKKCHSKIHKDIDYYDKVIMPVLQLFRKNQP